MDKDRLVEVRRAGGSQTAQLPAEAAANLCFYITLNNKCVSGGSYNSCPVLEGGQCLNEKILVISIPLTTSIR